MFRVSNIDELLQGDKKRNLDIFDDQQMKFMLSDKCIDQWEKVDTVSMKNSFCTIKALEELAKSPVSEKIKKLDLSQNFHSVNDFSLGIIVKSGLLQSMEELDLSDTEVSDQGLLKLLVNSICLQKLILYGNYKITSLTLENLTMANKCKLKYLDLRNTFIDDSGMQKFFNHHNSEYLEYLDLSMNCESITDATLDHLCNSSYVKFLRILKIANCRITDDGIQSLSTANSCAHLVELDISNDSLLDNNKITGLSVRSLGHSQVISGLEKLNLRSTQVDDDSLQYFLSDINCQNIRQLRLSWCHKITGKTLINIMNAAASTMVNLEKLYINDTTCERKTIMDFMKVMPHVEVIYNHDMDIDKKQMMEAMRVPADVQQTILTQGQPGRTTQM